LQEKRSSGKPIMNTPDYYEFLQISRNAEPATIHRVFQFLATRFHPDNAQTGDAEKFMLLKQAYEVLSNPARRAQYDATSDQELPQEVPLSEEIDFMDSIKGELNRRLGLLALLYARRRTNPSRPEVSLTEVEQRMGFPRDYLEFTVWYLQKKGYISRADNSDFALTAEGVDFVEEQREQVPVLNKLLTSDTGPAPAESATRSRRPTDPRAPSATAPAVDQRREMKDRRVGLPDLREIKVERRASKKQRRAGD